MIDGKKINDNKIFDLRSFPSWRIFMKPEINNSSIRIAALLVATLANFLTPFYEFSC